MISMPSRSRAAPISSVMPKRSNSYSKAWMHPDLEAPVAEHVGHADLPGQAQGIVVRDHQDRRAHPDAARGRGGLHHPHERGRRGVVLHQVVLREPRGGEARLVGERHHVERLVVQFLDEAGRVEAVAGDEQAEVHGQGVSLRVRGGTGRAGCARACAAGSSASRRASPKRLAPSTVKRSWRARET